MAQTSSLLGLLEVHWRGKANSFCRSQGYPLDLLQKLNCSIETHMLCNSVEVDLSRRIQVDLYYKACDSKARFVILDQWRMKSKIGPPFWRETDGAGALFWAILKIRPACEHFEGRCLKEMPSVVGREKAEEFQCIALGLDCDTPHQLIGSDNDSGSLALLNKQVLIRLRRNTFTFLENQFALFRAQHTKPDRSTER